MPGVTTLVCFAFVWLFALNVAATQLVNLALTPVSLALLVPHMALGNWCAPLLALLLSVMCVRTRSCYRLV